MSLSTNTETLFEYRQNGHAEESDFEKGPYIVNVFDQSELISNSTFTLK